MGLKYVFDKHDLENWFNYSVVVLGLFIWPRLAQLVPEPKFPT